LQLEKVPETRGYVSVIADGGFEAASSGEKEGEGDGGRTSVLDIGQEEGRRYFGLRI
jgi:hypothetical protein